jgi:hypothetical protein
MITQELIEQSVYEKINGSPSGCTCVFVQITDKIGAKLYSYEDDRDRCYKNQEKAAKYNFGPEIHGKFEFVLDKDVDFGDSYLEIGQTVYGYLTEVIEPCLKKEHYRWERVNYLTTYYDKQRRILVEELGKIGFDFDDAHWANVGFKDGCLLCLDFD